MNAQIYCTLDELIGDLNLNGDEPMLFSRIQTASRFIARRLGHFIPIRDTRQFAGPTIDSLLEVIAVLDGDTSISDYELYPVNRHWENGPYTRISAGSSELQITGLWGKWLQLEPVGVSITQTENAGEIAVDDGSILSAGMVLAVEDEQELVTGMGAPTALTSLMDGAVTAADEEIEIDDGTEIHEGEVIQISTERMFVRMIAGDRLVVARGWSGTRKQSHANDSPVSVYRTFAVKRGVNGTEASAHDGADLARYTPPEDVNWLCRQIAGLMRMKAKSGFAGKVGNAELGETFYFDEFPSQIKEIKRNYRIVQL